MLVLLNMTDAPADASPMEGKAAGAQPLVLVVEDHDDTRFMLRYLLETRGCRVAEAEDGEEGVYMAESLCPDIIVMDISLPRLDGLAATRRIRQLAVIRDVPIIFLSGHAQPDFRALALGMGGNDYLVKPLKLGDLAAAVEKHLEPSRAVNAGK